MASLEPPVRKRLHVVQNPFLALPKAASIFFRRGQKFGRRQKCLLHGVPLLNKIRGFHHLFSRELLNYFELRQLAVVFHAGALQVRISSKFNFAARWYSYASWPREVGPCQ